MLSLNTIYKLFRGYFPGEKSLGTYLPWEEFHEWHFCGSCLGGIIQAKMSGEQKFRRQFQWGHFIGEDNCSGIFVQGELFRGNSPGDNCHWENFIGCNCPGCSCPGGNFSRIILRVAKVRKLIALRGNMLESVVWGTVVWREMSGYHRKYFKFL